jgi:hypothetical protein
VSFFEMVNPHAEAHRGEHAGSLRAAVLGANDGLVSTASLMVGVASSGAGAATVLTAGIAGLAAGSMTMAAGEYVSVSSQVDVERGDRAKEQRELATNPEAELAELAASTATAAYPMGWHTKSPKHFTTPTHWPRTYVTNSGTPRSRPPHYRRRQHRRPASSSAAYYHYSAWPHPRPPQSCG